MSKVEFEKLIELSRRSTTDKPKTELIILSLAFFNGGKIGINELKDRIKNEFNDGWFFVDSDEAEKITPSLFSQNMMAVEGSNYVIPVSCLCVLKDIIEENLFPEKEEITKVLEKLDAPLQGKLEQIMLNLVDNKFYRYEESEVGALKELQKCGLLIFTRSFFSSADKISFGDKCVFVHPNVIFTVRSELIKNEFSELADIHKEEVFLLKRDKRDLIEKTLVQQERIDSLYEENKQLAQKVRNLEEFQRGTSSGRFLKNMVTFRIASFLRRKKQEEVLEQWEKAKTHDEILCAICEVLYLMGMDYERKDKESAEPDVVAISCYSTPPFIILGEVKTVAGDKKLGTEATSQIISKVDRYKRIYKGHNVLPIVIVNVEADQISPEALRDAKGVGIILTKSMVTNLVKSHLKHKHSPSLLYTLFEPRDTPIPSDDDIRILEALSTEENRRMKNELIES
jgi:hypothetical protein